MDYHANFGLSWMTFAITLVCKCKDKFNVFVFFCDIQHRVVPSCTCNLGHRRRLSGQITRSADVGRFCSRVDGVSTVLLWISLNSWRRREESRLTLTASPTDLSCLLHSSTAAVSHLVSPGLARLAPSGNTTARSAALFFSVLLLFFFAI